MVEDLRAMAMSAIEASQASADPDYPLFHLAPPVGRLNDPNGLIRHEGLYHACYQFSPFHPHRKLVYWGHASSSDLTTWRHHEPALIPQDWYDRDGSYSGSAIESGGEVYFAYTGNVRYPDEGRDTHQCLVAAGDLSSFTKVPQNPVIPEPPAGYTAHVRDPQIWAEGGGFRMCLGAQREDLTGCALLYSSPDLLEWRFDGELEFGQAAERFAQFGYMWECPAVVPVPDEATGQLHDVLIFCPQGIEPEQEGYENIFPACYVVGKLVGNEFRTAGDFYEIDRGFEFYAPQIFANDESGPVLLAWAGNASEDDQPSLEHGWVHLMSLGRELRLRDGHLIQQPRLNLAAATALSQELPGRLGEADLELAGLAGSRSFVLRLVLEVAPEANCRIRIGTADSHVDLDLTQTSLLVDRSATRYAPAARREVSLPRRVRRVIELYHDRSVTECFLDEGELSFTMRSYLDSTASGVTFTGQGDADLVELAAHRFD